MFLTDLLNLLPPAPRGGFQQHHLMVESQNLTHLSPLARLLRSPKGGHAPSFRLSHTAPLNFVELTLY